MWVDIWNIDYLVLMLILMHNFINISIGENVMRTTVTIDDALYEKALEMADAATLAETSLLKNIPGES